MAEHEGGVVRTLGLIEAAAFLRMHPSTLREKAKSKRIPGAKAGREWVFVEVDLVAFLRAQYEEAPCRYRGFTWHGLRHTWATWHMQNGTPIEVLRQLGAWADLRMVQNYAHHSESHLASFAGNTKKGKT